MLLVVILPFFLSNAVCIDMQESQVVSDIAAHYTPQRRVLLLLDSLHTLQARFHKELRDTFKILSADFIYSSAMDYPTFKYKSENDLFTNPSWRGTMQTLVVLDIHSFVNQFVYQDSVHICHYRFMWAWFINKDSQDHLDQTFATFGNYFFAITRASSDTYDITWVYNIEAGNQLSLPNGNWKQGTGLQVPDQPVGDRVKSFQGSKLPYTIEKSVTPSSIYQIQILFLYWVDMITTYNFTPQHLKVVDGDAQLLLDQLVRLDTKFNDEPSHKIYMFPYFIVRIYMYVKNREEEVWDFFFRPFDTKLWYLVEVWVLISAVMLAAAHATTLYLQKTPNILSKTYHCLFAPLDSACGQGFDVLDTWSSRVTYISTTASSVVFMSAFSAAITFFLMFHSVSLPFHNFKGFLENGQYVLDGLDPEALRFLQNATTQEQIDIRDKYYTYINNLPKDYHEVDRRMCNTPRYVLLDCDEWYLDWKVASPCKINRIPETVQIVPYSPLLGNKSQLREFFGIKQLRMKEVGQWRKLYMQHLSYQASAHPRTNVEYEAVDIHKTIPLVVVIGVASVLSSCILLLEMRIFSYRKNQQPTGKDSHHQNTQKQSHLPPLSVSKPSTYPFELRQDMTRRQHPKLRRH